jgi:predicted PurR-regulated permease PerM
VEAAAPAIVNNALALATGVASVLFNLIILLMFSFYIFLDGGKFADAAIRALPAERRDEANYLIYSIHRAFGGYIRGQLIQAVVYGVGTALVMLAANLSYTAVASVFAFVVMMIPFIGPILGLIPPVAISLLVHPESTWWVFLALLALQQVVLNVMAPRVLGQSVGVHPLVVLLALLVGARLAGIWGAIFAVPIAATVVAMISFYRLSVEDRAAQTNRVASETENGLGRSRPVSGR